MITTRLKNFLQLVAAILICQAAGLIGSIFTIQAIPTWYAELAKPSFNPPSWVFGPAWTTLYVLMGISAYLIWKNGWDQKNVKQALGIFAIQLTLNALWSFVFFGLQSPAWALVNIVALWLCIVWTMVSFHKISRLATLLLLPYLLWVSFASVLNFSIWQLN